MEVKVKNREQLSPAEAETGAEFGNMSMSLSWRSLLFFFVLFGQDFLNLNVCEVVSLGCC